MIIEINVCFQVLRVMTDGVEELSLIKMAGIDRVYAIVAFSCHRAASMAKRVLTEGRWAAADGNGPVHGSALVYYYKYDPSEFVKFWCIYLFIY